MCFILICYIAVLTKIFANCHDIYLQTLIEEEAVSKEEGVTGVVVVVHLVAEGEAVETLLPLIPRKSALF